MEYQNEEDRIRDEQRKARIERMREEKRKAIEREEKLKKLIPIAGGIVAAAVMIAIGTHWMGASAKNEENMKATEVVTNEETTSVALDKLSAESYQQQKWKEDEVLQSVLHVTETYQAIPEEAVPASASVFSAHVTDSTNGISDSIISERAIFIDLTTGDILAQKGYQDRINPASMTKVLTVLVAAENVENLDDTFTITRDITDFCFANDCSNVGFEVGETVTVRDMLYGTILPSGADAALGLAYYVAGSQEAFVEMMNAKLEELGLSSTTHFTNCMGIYGEDHYSTVYDIAMIMEAAEQNEICREVLQARTYTTSVSEDHPEGMILSNWFLRRIEDKDTGAEIIGAKTGYVVQSGSCAASAGKDADGKEYICVTAGSSSSWRCIYDQVELYAKYTK